MAAMISFIARVFSNLVTAYSFILVIYALLSWMPGGYYSKFGQWIIRIVEPYLSVFRRLNLRIGTIDFSVMAAIFALQFIERIGLQVLYFLFRLVA